MKYIFLLFIVLAACDKPATYHLPPERMKDILLDIHLAESYSMAVHPDSTQRATERNMDSLAVFYKSVFKHHNVDAETFGQSLEWYKQHPEELDSVYADLIPEMTRLEGVYSPQ